MTDKLTISIVGAGNIAGGYDENKYDQDSGVFSHAGSYIKNGKFILKSIFDTNNQKAKEFQQYWGVNSVANELYEIIDCYQDVISICSPDEFHFEAIKNIILNNSCKTLLVEKPLGVTLEEVDEIYKLSLESKINIVVNFQRHFDSSYKIISSTKDKILSMNCYYIKGLNHIGITMIDTLIMLLGFPKKVYSYGRHYNNDIDDYTYEFILFYKSFNVTVKTTDVDSRYNYHIFDLDILTNTKRYIFTDNGNNYLEFELDDYAYSGVKVLSNSPIKSKTEYNISMLATIDYIYNITTNKLKHTINTVKDSYNNHILINKIIESYAKNNEIKLKNKLWIR